jgi:hypothetical protein
MNYKLAKELKDAGFPQGTGRYFLEGGEHASGSAQEVEFLLNSFEAKDTKRYRFAYIPTLEELIEASGDTFAGVENSKPMHARWRAWSWDDDIAYGSTPLEAVARLWLALNAPSDAAQPEKH